MNEEVRAEVSTEFYDTCELTQTSGNGEAKTFKTKPLNKVVYFQSQDKYTVAFFSDMTSMLLNTPLKDFENWFDTQFIKPGRGVLLAKKFVHHAIRDVENLSIGMVHSPITFQVSRRERPQVRQHLLLLGVPFARVKGN